MPSERAAQSDETPPRSPSVPSPDADTLGAEDVIAALIGNVSALNNLERMVLGAGSGETDDHAERPSSATKCEVSGGGCRADLDLLLGNELLGELRLVAPVQGGTGASGRVFLAEWENDASQPKERYAAKIMRSGPSLDENLTWWFQTESKALRSLDHRNIVKFHRTMKTDGFYILVMEYVEGGSLETFLAGKNNQPQPELLVIDVVRQIADGLAHANEVLDGFVHRDIKPANILYRKVDRTPATPNGLQFLICDYGFALCHHWPRHSSVGSFQGTPQYASPQQAAMNSKAVTDKDDVFSLGVIAFRMLTGFLPFKRNLHDRPYLALLEACNTTEPVDVQPLRERDISCDEGGFGQLIQRMLRKKDRGVRPSAQEVADRAAALLNENRGDGVVASDACASPPRGVTAATVSPREQCVAVVSGASGGRRYRLFAAGVCGVVVTWALASAVRHWGPTQGSTTNVVAGQVRDSRSKAPVVGAVVTLLNVDTLAGRTPVATTDEHGRYRFDGLASKPHPQVRVQVRMDGYEASNTDQAFGTTGHTIDLQR